MIIKLSPVNYLHASANRDLLEYLKLPIVTCNNARRVEDMINFSYLENNKVPFKRIVGPHIVSLYTSTEEVDTEPTAYVEYYDNSKTLSKICLLNLLERSKYARGSLLVNLINSDSLFRNMKKDFDEEIINQAISAFIRAVENLEDFDCVDILQSINLLNKDEFKIVVDIITGELQKIYKLEYCSLMSVTDLNNKLDNNDLFNKYFIKQIRIEVPNQDTNHCFGSINASTSIIPYFNIKAIVDDSALIQREMNLQVNIVSDLKSLEEYLPTTSYNDLSGALMATVSIRTTSDFEAKIYNRLLLGEIIKSFIKLDSYYNYDDIYNEAVKATIESL